MDMIFIGILAYILLSLVIGVVISRGVRTEADYLLAGRNLGYTLATFSIFATWFGAETCIGASAAVYDHGISGIRADPFGYTICLVLMGLVFAVPLWNQNLTTMADLFRRRYSPRVERLAAVITVPGSLLWAAAQMLAFAHVLAASSKLELESAVAIAAGIVIIYTVTGGLLADVMTDLVQGIALIVGLVVLGIVMLVSDAPCASPFVTRHVATDADPTTAFIGWLNLIDSWAVPIFGSLVAQELISRVIASRSPRVARRATFLAAGLYLAVGAIPLYVGFAGVKLFPDVDDSEQIMALVAQKYLPGALYVIYAGALVSAILSTVDSCLLAASSMLSHNIVASFLPNLSDRARLLLARAGVIVLGLTAYLFALQGDKTYAMVADSSALGSAGLLVILTFGLFTRIGGAGAAMAALVSGTGSWLAWEYWLEWPGAFLASIAFALASYLAAAALGSRPADSAV